MMHFNGNLEISALPPSGDRASRTLRPLPPEFQKAYSQIGRVLLVAEASSSCVGVPWVPPTRRARALQTEYFEPLKDYVRSSLSTASTTALESYAEDIEELAPNDETSAHLGIDGLSALERFTLPGVVFITCFSGLLLSAVWAQTTTPFAIGIAVGVAALVAAACGYVCSERSRRSTFHWLIVEELMRRKGLDQPDSTQLPVYVMPTSPATKG